MCKILHSSMKVSKTAASGLEGSCDAETKTQDGGNGDF